MKVNLTFYGGVNEIGGNKILLQDRDTQIFLDFGMSFGRNNQFFAEFLKPRKCNCLGDFFAMGLLPDLPGVYRTDYLRHMGRQSEGRGVDAILISHAHMDHVAYLNHLRDDIPLHMSPGTHAILKAIQETSQGPFDDYLEYTRSFEIRKKERGEGYTRTKNEPIPRQVKIDAPSQKFKIGDTEIFPLPVDHSVPGSASYLIHTTEGTILYTGDLRFHGYAEEETREMIEKAKSEGVDLLLTEGTRIDQQRGTTESDVHDNASELVKNTRELTVVNFPERDLARFLTFHRIAVSTGRKLVIGFKQAKLLEEYQNVSSDYPSIDDPNILLYAERKDWGTLGRDDTQSNIPGLCIPREVCDQDYKLWERAYLYRENCVSHRDLLDHSQYMFYCNYFQINELIDVKPKPGSIYIRSITEPLDEEMEFDAQRIDNWLNHFNLTQHGRTADDRLHASGHASGDELKEMIDEITPKQIIPIHTEHPETMKKFHQNVVIPKEKDVFTL